MRRVWTGESIMDLPEPEDYSLVLCPYNDDDVVMAREGHCSKCGEKYHERVVG